MREHVAPQTVLHVPARVEEQDPTERPDHDDGQPHERDLGDGPSDAPARSQCIDAFTQHIGIVTVSQFVASKQAAPAAKAGVARRTVR